MHGGMVLTSRSLAVYSNGRFSMSSNQSQGQLRTGASRRLSARTATGEVQRRQWRLTAERRATRLQRRLRGGASRPSTIERKFGTVYTVLRMPVWQLHNTQQTVRLGCQSVWGGSNLRKTERNLCLNLLPALSPYEATTAAVHATALEREQEQNRNIWTVEPQFNAESNCRGNWHARRRGRAP